MDISLTTIEHLPENPHRYGVPRSGPPTTTGPVAALLGLPGAESPDAERDLSDDETMTTAEKPLLVPRTRFYPPSGRPMTNP